MNTGNLLIDELKELNSKIDKLEAAINKVVVNTTKVAV